MDGKISKSFEKIRGKKVLVMFSGGKDSTLCLLLLKKYGAQVEAIHFRHKWGWELSTSEARRIAKKIGVKLTEIDYTDEFRKRVVGFEGGRPCKICKPGMYILALKHAQKHNISYITVGDNASDTIISRLGEHVRKSGGTDLVFSRYLDCVNEGVKLPKSITVFRPLIYTSSCDVEKELKSYGISIKRNHETGDKYLEYWREGCPMQYNEVGHKVTEADFDKLYSYNLLCSELARKKGFRASIHMPSMRIVTIPAGHEKEVRKYLVAHGKKVKEAPNILPRPELQHYIIEVFGIDKSQILHVSQAMPLVKRFIERSGLKVVNQISHDFTPFGATMVFVLASSHMAVHTWPENNYIHFDLLSCTSPFDNKQLGYILFEVFKTKNYKIRKVEY